MDSNPNTLRAAAAPTTGQARQEVESFRRSSPCERILSRLDPSHPQAFSGQTLAIGQDARSELLAVQAELSILAAAARAPRSARPRMSPPLGSASEMAKPAGPSTVLTLMERFAIARDAILSIHASSASLDGSLRELPSNASSTLQQPAYTSLGGPISGLASDPLSAGARLALLASEASHGTAHPFHTSPQEGANQASLLEARASLGALKALRARRLLAFEQCKATIDPQDWPVHPGEPESITFLEQWLEKLRQVCTSGQSGPAAIGLSKLRAAIDAQVRLESTSLEAARAANEELVDLRGRFDAFKAKARALASQGRPLSENATLLQEACREGLSRRPAPLGALRKAQTAFEACVRELGS